MHIRGETVWLTQEQIAQLFDVKRPAITKHIGNIFSTQELDENSVCSILERTAADGKTYKTKFFNLDMILSVGYRVNSRNAVNFRRWASKILKDYLLKGYSVNARLTSVEKQLADQRIVLERHTKSIEFFVRTSLPPVEGVFYDGQIFDAYVFVSDLIRSARNSIILIDNYIDESVLVLLSKRETVVSAEIRTGHITRQLKLDVQKHNSHYPPINIVQTHNIHDRFLIVDDDVYHLGASLKDLGKKLFAFSKLCLSPAMLL